MDYISLYPTYIQAKEAFREKMDELVKYNQKPTGRPTELTIESPQGKFVFIHIPINMDISRLMGRIGVCDATPVVEYLEQLKREIIERAELANRRGKEEYSALRLGGGCS